MGFRGRSLVVTCLASAVTGPMNSLSSRKLLFELPQRRLAAIVQQGSDPRYACWPSGHQDECRSLFIKLFKRGLS
jgi:hypothetical protein